MASVLIAQGDHKVILSPLCRLPQGRIKRFQSAQAIQKGLKSFCPGRRIILDCVDLNGRDRFVRQFAKNGLERIGHRGFLPAFPSGQVVIHCLFIGSQDPPALKGKTRADRQKRQPDSGGEGAKPQPARLFQKIGYDFIAADLHRIPQEQSAGQSHRKPEPFVAPEGLPRQTQNLFIRIHVGDPAADSPYIQGFPAKPQADKQTKEKENNSLSI